MESREQALFGGFFAGHFAMLPKRFNVEMRFWDEAHSQWRHEQQQSHGDDAVPLDPTFTADGGSATTTSAGNSVALLHYVGRDKPWMRFDRNLPSRGARPETADDLCRRLREKDAPTCAKYLESQVCASVLAFLRVEPKARRCALVSYGPLFVSALHAPFLFSRMCTHCAVDSNLHVRRRCGGVHSAKVGASLSVMLRAAWGRGLLWTPSRRS